MDAYREAYKVFIIEGYRILKKRTANLVIPYIKGEVIMSISPMKELGITFISPRKDFGGSLDDPPQKSPTVSNTGDASPPMKP